MRYRVNADEFRWRSLDSLPDYGLRKGMVVYVDDLNLTDNDGELLAYFNDDATVPAGMEYSFCYVLPSALTPVDDYYDFSTVEGVLRFLLGSTDAPVAR